MLTAFHLFLQLLRRDLAGRFARSFAGFAWAVLQPLGQLVLFSFVFAYVLEVPLIGEAGTSFPIFLFAGLLPWLGFQESVVRGSAALVEHAELLKRHHLPLGLLVGVRVVAALVIQGIGLAAFAAILVWRRELSWHTLPWLFPALGLQALLGFGLASLLAPIQVVFRDTGQLLGLLLPAWFYATPIVYPLALVPGPIQDWLRFQPLTPIVTLTRAGLLGSPLPSWAQFLAAGAAALALLVLGVWSLWRAQGWIADEL